MKKKLSLLFATLAIAFTLCIFFAPLSLKTANAEELPTDSTTIDSTEEKPTEPTPQPETSEDVGGETETPVEPEPLPEPNPDGTITLTPEDIKEIINSALTEQQKGWVEKLSAYLSDTFGLNANTVYIFVAIAVVVGVFLIGLLIKVLVDRGIIKANKKQLEATQGAYSLIKENYEQAIAVLQSLSKEKLTEIMEETLPKLTDEVCKAITSNLKIDDDTLANLLGDNKILREQFIKVMEAIRAIAENNKDKALHILDEAPTESIVKEQELELQKLKTALGDEKVKEVLKSEV